ncbi:BRCA1-associated protein [Trichonephila clavipes]|uniref:BRCA1-associated protein n=2 Tax=Trichonephila clavipes TaxID=2585209 RepID=A0A8X7BK45_TRICX|nr:BRCA1-associated protein [Trichonephila clavipes]
MSVSLIALRLEIASDYPLLPHLHFVATKQKRVMTSIETNKGKEINPEEEESEESSHKYSLDKCRGSRVLQEMTVETVTNEVSDSVTVGDAVTDSFNVKEVASTALDSAKPVSHHKPSSSSTKSSKSKANEKKSHANAQKKSSKNETAQKEKQKSKNNGDVNNCNEKKSLKSTENVITIEDTNNALPVEVVTEDIVPNENVNTQECVNTDPDKRNRLLHPGPINFSSGNHFVEVTKGLLHLYKENHRTTLAEEAERSEMLCILAVPAAMTTHDLLQFVAPVYDDIENMRIIKDNKPNQYMVLLKFRNQLGADIFYKNFNGTRFNSIEPEICHLAFVAKVETIKESEEVSLPLPGLTELPTCPVCLERMDESVDGILTILCNHSFHGSCLAKWGDTSCPVCRYSQTPELMPDNRCVTCGSQDSLWICLICGNIGCGRYVDGHAYHHYLDTQHTYAMQLGNNRVWDYAGDNYVHRLVQNKADGKPVELEPVWVENEEKMDSMQLEYTYLLTSQLEAQRHYFEDRLTRIETEALKQLEEMKEKTKHAVDERKQLEEKLNRVTKEKQSMDKKISQLTSKVNRVMMELKDEKELNKCLRQNQNLWQQKLNIADKALKDVRDLKEKEISDLQEQVRDLMFYFDAKDKLKDVPNVSSQEIQEGQIVIGEASGTSNETSKTRKKKH